MSRKIPDPLTRHESISDWITRLKTDHTFVSLVGDWYEIELWCYAHLESPWTRTHGNRFAFKSAEDAMMASLVWS
ncbi:hypothetical protein UFOVP29_60 [uncultured Caudovirales phage]|uniref:Uncharacterized protein n=1 Tax=uncultured Caudovirales phage TaxID=2100421 RepID=A0A6J5KR36_9CAUD|nr:hypothetical protein UFOVP29_60 [uncultured Caudovirales phage]